MKISKIPGLGRFGIFVDDVDFDHITPEEWMEIGRLHINNLITIVRNTNIGADRFPDFVRKFGEFRHGFIAQLMLKYGFQEQRELWDSVDRSGVLDPEDQALLTFAIRSVSKNKKGQIITRVQTGYDKDGYPLGWFPDGQLNWHSNESGVLSSVPGVALLGQQNMVGSATGFVTTTDYYESVTESFRSELNEFVIVHRYVPEHTLEGMSSKLNRDILQLMAAPVDCSEVPLVRRSPGGILGLHYSPPTTYAIKGMSKQDSDRVFAEINQGLFQEKYIYNHWYQQDNDLLLFDNSICLHQRIGKTDGRMAYRLAFDYTNLQTGAYQPYDLHPHIARKYIQEINQAVKVAGITNFKLPGIVDYIKTFF